MVIYQVKPAYSTAYDKGVPGSVLSGSAAFIQNTMVNAEISFLS